MNLREKAVYDMTHGKRAVIVLEPNKRHYKIEVELGSLLHTVFNDPHCGDHSIIINYSYPSYNEGKFIERDIYLADCNDKVTRRCKAIGNIKIKNKSYYVYEIIKGETVIEQYNVLEVDRSVYNVNLQGHLYINDDKVKKEIANKVFSRLMKALDAVAEKKKGTLRLTLDVEVKVDKDIKDECDIMFSKRLDL